MAETGVAALALAGFDLESCFDDVAGSGQVCGWHTGHGTSGQEVQDAEFLLLGLAVEITLEMVVGWEVNGREGDIAEETGRGTFVEAYETEVANDPDCRATWGGGGGFGNFTLDLETDLDDFERVGEDLKELMVSKVQQNAADLVLLDALLF